MNRLLTLPARVLVALIARVIGPEMVYGAAAGEAVMAAIHHYSTEEVNDGERAA